MACITKQKFEENFGITLTNRNLISPEVRNSVLSYITTVQAEMKEEGFEQEVFTWDFKTNKVSGQMDYVLNFNQEASEKFDDLKHFKDSQAAIEGTQISLNLFNSQTPHIPDSSENFSPETIDIVDAPVNFKEWKDNRVALKKSLEKLAAQLRKHNNNRKKLKLVNKAIAEVERQLKNFNENDIDVVHESLVKEIGLLDNILDIISDNPKEASMILESYKVRERINELSVYFNGVDLMDEKAEPSLKMRKLLENTFDNARLYEVKDGINKLNEKYQKNLFTIIESIFANDTLVTENRNAALAKDKQESALSPSIVTTSIDKFNAAFNEASRLIESSEVTIGDHNLGVHNFVGAASVDSVLADLLFSSRENFYNQEVGQTQKTLGVFSKAWKKVKDVKVNGEYITTSLFTKDALGVRTNTLITPFKKAFGNSIVNINSARSDFYNRKNTDTYKSWMNTMKSSADIIQPYMLKEYQDKYKLHPLFREYFKASESEMAAYEAEMKAKMGATLFELEKDKLSEGIENYLTEAENSLFATRVQEYTKNPFTFINHFYSANYNEVDPSTSEYLEPSYVTYVPRLDSTEHYDATEFYNQDLKILESGEHGADLMEAYKHGYKLLTEYINPSLQAEGVNLEATELMNQMDILDREVLKQLNWFGRVPRHMKNLWNSIISSYTDTEVKDFKTKAEERQPFKTNSKFNIKYSSYGKNKRTILQNFHGRRSEAELIKMLKDKGVTVPEDYEAQGIDKLQLSKSLSQIIINENSSSNIFNSIADSVEVVRNMNARKNTMNIFDIFTQYSKDPKNKENDKEYTYLKDWGKLNLQKEKYVGDNPKFMQKSFSKTYMNLDRTLKEILKNERSNIQGNYSFIYGDFAYIKDGDKYVKQSTGVDNTKIDIAQTEMDTIYGVYVEELLENTGVVITLGSIANGFLGGIYKYSMRAFSPARYFMNRVAGLNQNMAAAATGEFGYNMKNLNISRNFLKGDIAKKIFHVSKVRQILGREESIKTKQMQTLLALAESLRILETSMESVKEEGAFGSKGILRKIDTMLTNTAVNYPEWKNQMESLLSVLQTVEIETTTPGVKKAIFDGKDFIYVPGTLTLKEEFRTEANVANWEEFKEDVDGNSPQNQTIALAKRAKRQTQGNYSAEDKVPILGSEVGKLASVFIRYLYENTNRQYGAKRYDLTTHKLDIKGNKLILAQHAPTFLTHVMLGNGWMNVIGGALLGGASLSVGAFASAAAVGPILMILVAGYMNRKVIQMNHLTKPEMKLALNYAMEVAIRSVNILPNYAHFNGISQESIEKMTHKAMPAGMTAAERNLMSGSAQELAQKMGLFLGSAITTTLITGLYMLAAGGDKDDEKKKKMAQLEKVLNNLINLKGQFYSDIEKFTNPIAFADAAMAFVYYKMLKRNYTRFNKAFENYGNDAIEEGELTMEILKSGGFVVGLPKGLIEIAEPRTLIEAERVYGGKDWFDESLSQHTNTAEGNFKKASEKLRDPVRNRVKNKIRDLYKEADIGISEGEISKLSTAWLKNKGFYAQDTDKKGYENLFNNQKLWDNATDLVDEMSFQEAKTATARKTKKRKKLY